VRSDPAEYEIFAPGGLRDILAMMADSADPILPIAGGTDVMVQYAAGTLRARKLVSIWNVPDLRRVEVLRDEVRIGAGSTYTDLRRHETIAREFPLLAQAASWIGGIANQNRGTIGGNIANASPAGDSLPALLAYDAELILVSIRGERRVAYRNFHAEYKKMDLAADELIRAVCLPRRYGGYVSYTRKVGTRQAQAISKVCIAALGRVEQGAVADVRIATGSVAAVPMRLAETERVLAGRTLDTALIEVAARTAVGEVKPIDDIRSTARYRSAVVRNLVVGFLEQLRQPPTEEKRSGTLARWNALSAGEAANEILACCGSQAWARWMAARRPFATESALLAASDEVWRGASEADWFEAFRAHPRIGEKKAEQNAPKQSASWSAEEQSTAEAGEADVKAALAEGNREYEQKFGRIFIVCATGKSSGEILQILRQRLRNDDATELREAAEQQRQITQLRLRKWLRD
jgi:OHCU decarboxylase